jgi:hypothetical protein
MPNSQSYDADNDSDASKANSIDNKPTHQQNQLPAPKGVVPERFLVEQARITDLLCGIIIVSLIVACALRHPENGP